MATFYSAEATNYLNTVPAVMENGAYVGGQLRRFRATVTMAAQTTSDTIVLAKIPRSHVFAYGVLTTSATLGTSTIAIGITGTTGKYRAAATFTATDTPTMFGIATVAGGSVLSSEETVFITIGTATLPGSGTLVVDLYFSGT